MALFSKRHYVAIAAQLHKTRAATRVGDNVDTIDCLVRDLADMFASDNPAFNYNKFLDVIEAETKTEEI